MRALKRAQEQGGAHGKGLRARLQNFSIVSLRDLVVASGPTILMVAAAVLLAYWWVDPAPPRSLRLATGQENSAYETFGKQYASLMARDDIKVTLQPTLGSQDNLQRLLAGEADVAFVQSGSTDGDTMNAEDGEAAERRDLISLGSLFTEPVWLFLREEARVTKLTDLRGKRINLGPEGTGVPRLLRQVLDANGIEPKDLQIGDLANTPATVELLAGRIDGLVFSSAPEAPLIQMLLQTPGIRLFDFAQAEAYTRRLPFLTHVVLPRGIVDLGRDIPSQDFHLIAPTATLVARDDLHPALIDLFVKAAAEIDDPARQHHVRQEGQAPRVGFGLAEVEQANARRLQQHLDQRRFRRRTEHEAVDSPGQQFDGGRRVFERTDVQFLRLDAVHGQHLAEQVRHARPFRPQVDAQAAQAGQVVGLDVLSQEQPHRLGEQAAQRNQAELVRFLGAGGAALHKSDVGLAAAQAFQVLLRAERRLQGDADFVLLERLCILHAKRFVSAVVLPCRQAHLARRGRIDEEIGGDAGGRDEDDGRPRGDQ